MSFGYPRLRRGERASQGSFHPAFSMIRSGRLQKAGEKRRMMIKELQQPIVKTFARFATLLENRTTVSEGGVLRNPHQSISAIA